MGDTSSNEGKTFSACEKQGFLAPFYSDKYIAGLCQYLSLVRVTRDNRTEFYDFQSPEGLVSSLRGNWNNQPVTALLREISEALKQHCVGLRFQNLLGFDRNPVLATSDVKLGNTVACHVSDLTNADDIEKKKNIGACVLRPNWNCPTD